MPEIPAAAVSRRVGPGSSRAPRHVSERCADGAAGHPIGRVHVVVWRGNYSAFNGYRFQPSDYSLVECSACHASWRTNALYVDTLRNSAW